MMEVEEKVQSEGMTDGGDWVHMGNFTRERDSWAGSAGLLGC